MLLTSTCTTRRKDRTAEIRPGTYRVLCASVAQSEERLFRNQRVAGSIPVAGLEPRSFNWTGHLTTNQELVGSNPIRGACGALAQLDSARDSGSRGSGFKSPASLGVML